MEEFIFALALSNKTKAMGIRYMECERVKKIETTST